GHVHLDRPHSGRPRILTSQEVHHLKFAVTRGDICDATDAQCLEVAHVSARTVRRRLCDMDLHGCV
ncbi:hypothetical protein BV20DRAFT_903865, partial [Pilatotrama ljubarskyi]